MKINQIFIQRFKRFSNLTVTFNNLDGIIGANNSGKSTLLQALALFDFCLHRCLSRKNGQDLIELKNRSISPEEFIVFPVAHPLDLWTDKSPRSKNQRVMIAITVKFDNSKQIQATIDWNFNRFGLSVKSEKDTHSSWLQELAKFKVAYLPVFSTFLPQEYRSTKAVIEESFARGRVNSVIRNLLLNLKEEKRDSELAAILKRVFSDLENLRIEFDELSDQYITVTYQETGRKKEFDIFSSGSGFQQFVYLFGFILLRQPNVILLDEPDVHLHGTLQKSLLDELRRLVQDGKQVIFATHSHDLITQIEPENLLILVDDTAKRLQVAYDVYDTLSSLGSLEITQIPKVQRYRRVLVLEDKDDYSFIQIFSTKVLGEKNWLQISQQLAICYAKGNPVKQEMPRLRQQLQDMLTEKGGKPLKMLVVADRDYYPYLDELTNELATKDKLITWQIWQRNEIENYLLEIEPIKRLLNPSASLTKAKANELETKWSQLIEDNRDTANDRLVKAFAEYGRTHKKGWDAASCSKEAREYLKQRWESEKLSLTDAKEVLSGIKRWLQNNQYYAFSNKTLAENFLTEELAPEVHRFAEKIHKFISS